MKRIGVDTNVVVSLLTDRDPGRQARAAELFGAATAGELVIVVHQAVIAEAVYVMCNVYTAKPNTVSVVMRDLLSLPGVVIVDSVEWPAVWRLWPRRIKDFGDACLTVIAKSEAFDALATFDATFAKRARRHDVPTYW